MGEGGGDGAGGNHHGTRITGVSCRQRLLQMRVPVVVQDHAVWLPSGGSQLRVLSVPGAVRQRCDPDPAGQALSDARETRGRRGTAERETVMGAAKGGSEERASRGDREESDRGDDGQRPSTGERPDATGAIAYRGESSGEGGRRRDSDACEGRGNKRRRTQARISAAASLTTRRGKRGGVTLRSCHRGAMTR